jgi:hypothetical protein
MPLDYYRGGSTRLFLLEVAHTDSSIDDKGLLVEITNHNTNYDNWYGGLSKGIL